MNDLQNFIVDVGNVLANGKVSVENTPAYMAKVKAVVESGKDATDADWAELRALEKPRGTVPDPVD